MISKNVERLENESDNRKIDAENAKILLVTFLNTIYRNVNLPL
jgi:hypothetical protein